MSSSRTAGSSGALARRMNASQPPEPRTWFDSRTAVRRERLSRTIAIASTTNATTGDRTGSGCVILWMPSKTEKTAPPVNSTTATMNA